MEPYIEHAPCVFLVFTEHGRLLAVNQTACDLTGWQREELLQKNFSNLITLGSRIFAQTHLFPLLRLEQHCEEIYIVLQSRTGEEVPLLLNVKRSPDGDDYIAVGIPIHNRNKYEAEIIAAKKYAEKALSENKELQQAKEELQRRTAELDAQLVKLLQQNENLNQLNWTLTHTMQEPLRKIAVFSSAVLHHDTDAKTAAWVKKINGLALQTRGIFIQLQDYLQLGLRDSQGAEDVDVRALITEIAATIKAEGHTVTVRFDEATVVKGFEAELRMLFKELLKNAVQFRRPGSLAAVAVEGTTVQANAYRMLKERYQYANYLRISVRDEGIGFPASHTEQIFGLFSRLNHTSPGLGMGLAVCRRIMELHQGFITADSDEGKGTVINCFFPVETGFSGNQ